MRCSEESRYMKGVIYWSWEEVVDESNWFVKGWEEDGM